MVGATILFSILLPSLVAQNIKYKVPQYKADYKVPQYKADLLSDDVTGEKKKE